MLFPHIALQNTVSSNVDSVRSSKQIGLYQHPLVLGLYQSPSRGLRPESSAASAVGAFPDLRFLKCSFTRSETACLLSSTFVKISSNSYHEPFPQGSIHSSKTQLDTTMDPVISTPSKTQTKYVYNEPDSSRNQDTYI